jgi:hypothetical protein
LKWHRPANQGYDPLGVGVIAMGIEPEILLAEPFFEPFHEGYGLMVIGCRTPCWEMYSETNSQSLNTQ